MSHSQYECFFIKVFEIINLKVINFTFKLNLNVFLLLVVCKIYQLPHVSALQDIYYTCTITWVLSTSAVTWKKLNYYFSCWFNFHPVHYKRVIILLPAIILRTCFLNASLHRRNWWDSIRKKTLHNKVR